ncbi:MAG: TonB-dependent receptor plug domain-containing protein [Saprospiraceae bacterium]|nr:TonB-dependent receptor plug domain-containing protein [Saprospiraceae bacterium]
MKKSRGAILSLSLVFLSAVAVAQSALDVPVNLGVKEVSLEQALLKLIQDYDVRLSFSNNILPDIQISANFKKKPLRQVLDALLEDTDISYREIGNQIVLYQKERPDVERKFTISGFVEDADTGERLIAASVYDRRLGKGVETNEYGFFSLTLPQGDIQLSVNYLGYIPQEYNFKLNSDKRLQIELNASLLLPVVEIIAHDSIVSDLRSGHSSDYFNAEDIEQLPALGGEPDLIRATHLLPGVQTGTDGIGGIHVRGGNAEHNLILIDGVPVYNALHAAGLFSVFNTDAIRSAQLIKGGFSARYGGRLSSVLDVHTKEGNLNRLSGTAEIGLLTARASLEGPLIKEKSSFFVSARRSFLNWYTRPISEDEKAKQGIKGKTLYDFFDVNAKVNYEFSPKDKVYLSYYQGNDHFDNDGFSSDSFTYYSNRWEDTVRIRYDSWYGESLSWGNTVAAARWNHIFGNKLFANTTLTYSRFATNIYYGEVDSLVWSNRDTTLQRVYDFGRFRSSIEDVGGRMDFDWLLSPSQTIRFGWGLTEHQFNPGALTYNEIIEYIGPEDVQGNDPINSTESFAYLESNMVLGSKFALNIGVHAARLKVQEKTYNLLQPRLSAYWSVGERFGMKAAYGEMAQFLHLLSNSSIGLPTDLWVPATADVPPQQAWQASTGFDYDFKVLELSIEGYYKKMHNLLNYTEGAYFLNDWEENVTSGQGRAYGIEMLLRKSKGNTTGWMAYTLSWSDRRFELINLGERYPFKYDRRHDLKIVLQHAFSKWMRVSASWIVSSGFAVSLPIAEYYYEKPNGNSVPVIDYGSKNQFRMPYYHRLDISANFNFKTRSFWHDVNIGFYNLYNRKNPLYYDLRTNFINENGELKEKKEYVQVWLLPILPSVNYAIKF